MRNQASIHQNKYLKILLIFFAMLLLGKCTMHDENGEPAISACDRPYVSVPGKIVYADGSFKAIYVLKNQIVGEVLPAKGSFRRAGPRWSPDGSYVAYVLFSWQDHEDSPADYKRSISIINPDGTPCEEIVITGTCPGFKDNGYADLAWSADGSRIAYLKPEDAGFSVCIANIGQGDETIVATLEGSPLAFDWSPDGSKFILSIQNSAENTNTYRIMMIDHQGTLLHQSNSPNSNAYSLRWSPNGSNILLSYFDGENAVDGQTVHLMSSACSGLRRVTKDASIAAWSPDGNQIVCLKSVLTKFDSYLDAIYCYYLCTMDLTGNEKQKISARMDRINVKDLDWTGS